MANAISKSRRNFNYRPSLRKNKFVDAHEDGSVGFLSDEHDVYTGSAPDYTLVNLIQTNTLHSFNVNTSSVNRLEDYSKVHNAASQIESYLDSVKSSQPITTQPPITEPTTNNE